MRILIAEDEAISRRMLAARLEAMGHEVLAAPDGRQAWDVLRRNDVRLVIADWEMPEMDGLELVRKVRAEIADRYVYLMILTSHGDKKHIVEGLAAGADDYITKPFDPDELMVRINAGQRVIQLEAKLADANEKLAAMAREDGLTGVANRRSFDEDFRQACNSAVRYHHPFSIVMADIDHFKNYNDALGHEAGDEALRRVARMLSEQLRRTDKVYRYGGEEFSVLLANTGGPGAAEVAERLRARVRTEAVLHPGNPPSGVLTISVGLASYERGEGAAPEDLLSRADQALYQAKSLGRDRVVVWNREHATS